MNTLVSEVSVRTETLVATCLHKAIKRDVPTAKLPYTWYIDCAYKDENGIEYVVTAWHNAKPPSRRRARMVPLSFRFPAIAQSKRFLKFQVAGVSASAAFFYSAGVQLLVPNRACHFNRPLLS